MEGMNKAYIIFGARFNNKSRYCITPEQDPALFSYSLAPSAYPA
jgi:hypothetical protein